MSDDWQVGDLAVCVDVDIHKCGPLWHAPRGALALGTHYRVASVVPADCGNCLGLIFEDGTRFIAQRFRKIHPDKHEDCEPEFVTLLNRIKRKVSA